MHSLRSARCLATTWRLQSFASLARYPPAFAENDAAFGAGGCPAFVLAPEAAGDLAGHGGDALLVLLVDVHAAAGEHPVEDQVLDLVRDQFMRHGGEVQFAQVDMTEQPLALFPCFGGDVVGVALVFALEPGWAFGNIHVDPLPVAVEVDTKSWFGHFLRLFSEWKWGTL